MSIKLKNNGGSDFDPVPSGVHQAVCYGVADIGTQKSAQSKYGPKRKIILLFELPHERADFGEDRKNLPRGISSTYTQSLSDKALLRRDLESWRGHKFTEKELEGFDPKVLIGVNCQLNIVHNQKGDKTYANIVSIIPLSKGQPKVAQENPSLYFSLDDQSDMAHPVFPANMPKWIQEKVTFSEEVQAALNGGGQSDAGEELEEQRADEGHVDEDVPF